MAQAQAVTHGAMPVHDQPSYPTEEEDDYGFASQDGEGSVSGVSATARAFVPALALGKPAEKKSSPGSLQQ